MQIQEGREDAEEFQSEHSEIAENAWQLLGPF
jgi:hypothetical protein